MTASAPAPLAQDKTLRQSLDTLGVGHWEYGHAADHLSFSPGLVAMLGGDFPPPGGASLAAWMAHVHVDDKASIATAIEAAIRDDTPFDVEYRFHDAQGEWLWLHARGHVAVRDAQATGRPRKNEEWLTFAASGYHGLFETTKTPMYSTAGRFIGVLGLAHDIAA
jgi:PAS domain-containing protein